MVLLLSATADAPSIDMEIVVVPFWRQLSTQHVLGIPESQPVPQELYLGAIQLIGYHPYNE